MPNLYLPQLFDKPAKTYDNPSVAGVVFKGIENMTKMYYINKEEYSKNIKTPIDNVQVHEKDQSILNDARQTVTDMMSPVIEEDSFHRAGSIITKTSDYIRSNQELKQAMSDNAALQAANKETLESKFSDTDKETIIQRRNFEKQKVYRDPTTGAVKSGLSGRIIADAYDDTMFNTLLSTVNSKADYPITESEVEGLMQNAKAAGFNIDVDDDGNPATYITTKNGVKYLDKNRVVKAVESRLRNSSQFIAFQQERASLELFRQQYSRSTKATGKAPSNTKELQSFTGDDLVSAVKMSPYDYASIMQYYKDDKAKLKVLSDYSKSKDAKLDGAVSTLITDYYTKQGVDADSAFKAVFTNGYVSSSISNISNGIGDQLSFRSASSSMQFHNNPSYLNVSQRAALEKETGGKIALGPIPAVAGRGELIVQTGRDFRLAADNADKTVAAYNTQLYNLETRVLGQILDGLPVSEAMYLKMYASQRAMGLDVSQQVATMSKANQERFMQLVPKYDRDGKLKDSEFNEEQQREYNRISQDVEKAKYNSAAASTNYDIWRSGASKQIDINIEDFINSNRTFNYDNEYVEKNIYNPLIEKYGFQKYMKGLNSDSMPFNSTGVSSTLVHKYMKDNPNSAFTLEAKKALKEQAPNYMDASLFQGEGAYDVNQVGRIMYNAPKQVQQDITQMVMSLNPHQILASTLDSSDDKTDVLKLLESVRGKSNEYNNDILRITPLVLYGGGIGASITNNETGEAVVIKLDMSRDQELSYTRATSDKAWQDHKRNLDLQAYIIQEANKGIVGSSPMSVNGTMLPISGSTKYIDSQLQLGKRAIVTFDSPSKNFHGYENSQVGFIGEVIKTDTGYSFQIIEVTGLANGRDPKVIAKTQQEYFPYDYSYDNKGVTYNPQGFATVTDLVSHMASYDFITIQNNKQQR